MGEGGELWEVQAYPHSPCGAGHGVWIFSGTTCTCTLNEITVFIYSVILIVIEVLKYLYDKSH